MERPNATPPVPEAVDSIDDLETARMALRWALERIHALEQLNGTLQEKLEAARQDPPTPLPAGQRQRYFDTMERYALMALAGKLDIEALVKRELEAADLRDSARFALERLRRDEASARLILEKLCEWEAAARAKLEQLHGRESDHARLREEHAQLEARLERERTERAKTETAFRERMVGESQAALAKADEILKGD
ncbi:MAG: hypothetical protein HY926_08495 [Elusimicrobia bacterium]|nr:hypothetical protein [Elusimicrobiota bacterium]